MKQQKPQIYMDHSATTPVREEVLAVMQPYFAEFYGNASSIHGVGRRAGTALNKARRTIAEQIGTTANEIVFTGCGTESDNAAVRGIAIARRQATGANRIITTAIEHHAVIHTGSDLRDFFGFELTVASVSSDGLVSVTDIEDAIRVGGQNGDDVAVVSVMYANNEVGTVQPIAEIGAICKKYGIVLTLVFVK